MNIYYKQSDITASLSELMISPWALECDDARRAGIQEALHLIQDMINGEVPETMKIPTVDVREVVRGHWNYKCPIDGTSYRYCSNCLGVIYDSGVVIPKNFCPNCGADMREN